MNEAELLFTDLLNYNRTEVYLNRQKKISREQGRFIASVLRQRCKGRPIHYILGQIEFMDSKLRLTPDVFIPRPETEILVETALNIGKGFPARGGKRREKVKGKRLRVLDLGTGSGNIAISLAKFLPHCAVIGIDISGEALEIAEDNARLNNLDNVKFIQGDLFSLFTFHFSPFTLIVSNPPYVPTAEIEALSSEVCCEPRVALDGGRDGLEFYPRIIAQAGCYLKKHGFLIMEMGFGQCEPIKELIKKSKKFKIIDVVKDYQGIDRVIVAQNG
ncbi:MAG: peptide chain release factor N(5)-glutamine methyltransferase [Candidatus Omnitrophica bacterium]|nr:peptide chain release factor N(5)-glutamine methyltransferase [Candidatus Omnitrophota bacterium]